MKKPQLILREYVSSFHKASNSSENLLEQILYNNSRSKTKYTGAQRKIIRRKTLLTFANYLKKGF
jgi:hypothetical protein